jgi:hypothetical protein
MRITKTDVVLSAIMFASLVVLHVMRENGLIFVAMLAPSFFFVFPLCQAFQKGITSARDHIRGTAAGSPWKEFGKVIWPRLAHWFVLWMVYFAVVEVYLETVIGGLNWIASVSNAGLVLGMIGACFIWAPRCENLWTLALATGLTVVPAFSLFLFLGAIVLEVFGLGGYMGLGIVIYSPFVASGCLFVAAIVSSLWARCRGNTWFRASREG